MHERIYLEVSSNAGTPKSIKLDHVSIETHSFGDSPYLVYNLVKSALLLPAPWLHLLLPDWPCQSDHGMHMSWLYRKIKDTMIIQSIWKIHNIDASITSISKLTK